MKFLYYVLCAGILTTTSISSFAQTSDFTIDQLDALVEEYVKESFREGPGQDLSRLKQDETLKTCSKYSNTADLSRETAQAILKRERESLRYPENGQLMGDWKKGEKYFSTGFAYRIGNISPDNPDKNRGGNCYACHGADPEELAYGTLGTNLINYGKLRGNSDEVIKYTYEKIYNSQSFVPCSQMPRLGRNGILTPEKIADIVAYLLSPDSPVNQ